MTIWILAALGIFFAQLFIAPIIRYASMDASTSEIVSVTLGARDDQPELNVHGRRAARALANMHEALPIFLTLGLLLIMYGVDEGIAVTGAIVFVVSRAVYVPLYIFGVFGLRSTAWSAAVAGMVMMLIALIGAM